MQAYATAERLPIADSLSSRDKTPRVLLPEATPDNPFEHDLVNQVLNRFADLVVERLMNRTNLGADHATEWLDAREAAAYLGLHRDTLRKLAAQRAVPTHQDAPGCKHYFRRDELDHWRRSARPRTAAAARLSAVS